MELQAAVEKIKQKKDNVNLDEKIKLLFSQLQQPAAKLTNKIALPIGDAMQFMEPDEIIRCESDSNYTHIFLANGKKLTFWQRLIFYHWLKKYECSCCRFRNG